MPNPWQGGSFCYNQPLRLRHLATNQYLAMRDDAVDIGALSSSFWPFSPLLRRDAAAAATHGQGARMGVGMSARRPLLQLGSLSCSIKTPQSDLIS